MTTPRIVTPDHPVDFVRVIDAASGEGHDCVLTLSDKGDTLLHSLTDKGAVRQPASPYHYVQIEPPTEVDAVRVVFADDTVFRNFARMAGYCNAFVARVAGIQAFTRMNAVRRCRSARFDYPDVDAVLWRSDRLCISRRSSPTFEFHMRGVSGTATSGARFVDAASIRANVVGRPTRCAVSVWFLQTVEVRFLDEFNSKMASMLQFSLVSDVRELRCEFGVGSPKSRCNHTERALTFCNRAQQRKTFDVNRRNKYAAKLLEEIKRDYRSHLNRRRIKVVRLLLGLQQG